MKITDVKVLVAGDHVVSTDACGAWLMGRDPGSGTDPIRRTWGADGNSAERARILRCG